MLEDRGEELGPLVDEDEDGSASKRNPVELAPAISPIECSPSRKATSRSRNQRRKDDSPADMTSETT